MLRYLVLAIVLLAVPAGAQMAGEEVKACVPNGDPMDPEGEQKNLTRNWPQEAERYKGNDQNVSRRGDLLRLALEGGKTVELVDCPYGDTAYQYLYERYDDAGRFYVIRTPAHEDFSYTLVMKLTGRLFTVYSSPVWTSDKSRFLTVACTLLPTRGSLAIHKPSDDGLALEAEIELPCGMESCAARWDFQSWISVSCMPWSDTGKKGTEFVVLRGGAGSWRRFGR